MRLNEASFGGLVPVDGYGPGFFRIAGQVVEGPVLLRGADHVAWGGYGDTESLLALAGDVDVLFIGTGADTAHLPRAFRDTLEAAGLGVENMATPAAARTFNVLLSEGRRVAAALLPVAPAAG
ncbi:MAG: Mth938-like domain-containing protein [Rhodobacteraceae bacterium]|nr:Mth938-like domain-containing protein [Paracoccaceae bacterium]